MNLEDKDKSFKYFKDSALRYNIVVGQIVRNELYLEKKKEKLDNLDPTTAKYKHLVKECEFIEKGLIELNKDLHDINYDLIDLGYYELLNKQLNTILNN